MRRLWRILFDAITTIFLILAVAIAMLWIRSTLTQDELLYHMIHPESRTFSFYAVRSYPGVIGFVIFGMYYADPEQFKISNPGDPAYAMTKLPWGWSRESSPAKAYQWSGSFWNRRGFSFRPPIWRTSPSPPMARGQELYCVVSAPHWFLILLFLILPGLRLRRATRAWRHSKLKLCSACGYDLRASTERCPECGMVVATISGGKS